MGSPDKTRHRLSQEPLRKSDRLSGFGASFDYFGADNWRMGRMPRSSATGSTVVAVVLTIAIHVCIISYSIGGWGGGWSTKNGNYVQPQGISDVVTTLILAGDEIVSSTTEMPSISQPLTTDEPEQVEERSSVSGYDFNEKEAQKEFIESEDPGEEVIYGRYISQIKARIERAWDLPIGSSVNEFSCQAQIKQKKDGAVEEVTLVRCDEDVDWQMSLVKAIEQASPLSAPPNESAFTSLISVIFFRTLGPEQGDEHKAIE